MCKFFKFFFKKSVFLAHLVIIFNSLYFFFSFLFLQNTAARCGTELRIRSNSEIMETEFEFVP